jgi:hypothetical protein
MSSKRSFRLAAVLSVAGLITLTAALADRPARAQRPSGDSSKSAAKKALKPEAPSPPPGDKLEDARKALVAADEQLQAASKRFEEAKAAFEKAKAAFEKANLQRGAAAQADLRRRIHSMRWVFFAIDNGALDNESALQEGGRKGPRVGRKIKLRSFDAPQPNDSSVGLISPFPSGPSVTIELPIGEDADLTIMKDGRPLKKDKDGWLLLKDGDFFRDLWVMHASWEWAEGLPEIRHLTLTLCDTPPSPILKGFDPEKSTVTVAVGARILEDLPVDVDAPGGKERIGGRNSTKVGQPVSVELVVKKGRIVVETILP